MSELIPQIGISQRKISGVPVQAKNNEESVDDAKTPLEQSHTSAIKEVPSVIDPNNSTNS